MEHRRKSWIVISATARRLTQHTERVWPKPSRRSTNKATDPCPPETVQSHVTSRWFMNKYLAEFIGTFFLVLTIGCTVIGHGAGPFAPLAIGSALMVMVFAGGHISGGHFNPAVTLGVWLRGKCETKDVAPYMIFQIMGGVLAALVVKFLKGEPLLHRSTRRLHLRFWRSFFSPLPSYTSY